MSRRGRRDLADALRPQRIDVIVSLLERFKLGNVGVNGDVILARFPGAKNALHLENPEATPSTS